MMDESKRLQLINDGEAWWNNELERSIMQVYLYDVTKPHTLSRGQLLDMVYDKNVSPEEVANKYFESLDGIKYLGDAFPHFYMRSTGVLGAYLGQEYNIDIKHGTIWFKELEGKELADIHPELLDTQWLYRRSLDLIKAFQNRYGKDIALGIANLGGMMDIVESMRGANNSLLDLYDDPDEVKRLNDDIYIAYEKAYNEMIRLIDVNKVMGYTGWITLLSQKPFFISQCDFCCMVGPEQFDEFIFDTLKKEVSLIERSFYHLDGPGAVKHLDRILECGFKGIQWINGAGAKPLDDPIWDDVYKKIHNAGCLLQVFCYTIEEAKRFIPHITKLLGTTKGIAFICTGISTNMAEWEALMSEYNIPI